MAADRNPHLLVVCMIPVDFCHWTNLMEPCESPAIHQTQGPDETQALASRFGKLMKPGDIVLLNGPLGAGKTNFVRGLCSGLGMADLWEVSSPTYTVVNHYDVGTGVDHIDLYRFHGSDDLDEIGFDDMLTSSSIKLIEWPERMQDYPLPQAPYQVHIRINGEQGRTIEIQHPPE